ncbi:hypothetical protein SAMN02983004_00147 [Borreliella japonica]|uniref:Uncharacterized protein n=1 Tax=Borreliella japonica TaxID=34095 RepID=A0A1G4P3C6_BORJA|nr:hypothetical protein [Borreliella japonica]WKC89274.1 hypothetical protein QIA20_04145 [Borreliella japonica]SCW26772.1 hypothetical protein SAMN02983004_00147 [Borreliella japonica]
MKYTQSKFKGSSNFQKYNKRFYGFKNKKLNSESKSQNVFPLNNSNSKSTVLNPDKQNVFKGKFRRRSIKFKTRINFDITCAICEKKINDLVFSMSLKVKNEDKPVHFDCAINKLTVENNLSNSEKLVYRGVGKFFIVDTSSRGEYLYFKIIKEIEFENLKEQPIWRKKILKDINRGFRLC